MKKKYTILLIAVLVLSVFVNSACRRDSSAAGRTRTDTLIWASLSMPVNLDPTLTNDMASARVHPLIYDTLLNMDYDMNPEPGLAERWQFENDAQGQPTIIRLFLKRGVYFHNGDELNARIVKFSLDRAIASPVIGHITGMIQSVEVVNDYEVLIRLPYPFSPILNHLAHRATSIVNERALTEMGPERHSMAPVGTGPYIVTNIVTGDRIELTAWDRYHGTPAPIPNMIVRVLPDPATRQIELETGGVDIILDIPPTDISRVLAHPDLQLARGPNFYVEYIGFTVTRPPFDDVRVRQAINYAIDAEAVIRAAYMGAGSLQTGPLSPRVWASTADRLPVYEYNPERARQLLAEAGFPNGFTTDLWTNENPARVDVCEIVQNMLAQVGITVEIRIAELSALLETTARGETDMFSLGWRTVTGDADYGLIPLFHTTQFGAAGNRSYYSNPVLDRILDEARAEPNRTRREQLYAEAQQIIRDDAVWVFLWVGESINALRADLRGFQIHPSEVHRMWELYFE